MPTPIAKNELPDLPFEKWLNSKQVGGEFGVNEDTILHWWHVGLPTGKNIPEKFMRRRGFKDYLFHPKVIEFIRDEQLELA
jgi:hypothetical protein